MEYQKISKILQEKVDFLSKIMTRDWTEINNQSNSTYTYSKTIKFTANISRSTFWNLSDSYIAFSRKISGTTNNAVVFKILALFTNHIIGINISQVDAISQLDLTILMYIQFD